MFGVQYAAIVTVYMPQDILYSVLKTKGLDFFVNYKSRNQR